MNNKLLVDIKLVRKGDKNTFEKIYMEFFDVLYHLSLQYINKEEVAEELVQDAFMKLWEVRETLNESTNIRNFLFTITRNNCMDILRNEQVRVKHLNYLKYMQMQFNYEAMERLGNADLDYSELQQRIENAIKALPDDLQRVFVMSRFEDLKYQEIADQLDVSIKTIEFRISKALKLLRSELKDYLSVIYIITNLLS